ncbi:acetyl-CoA sensor PanZ family protein [Kistimonas scapharcae]|uniref:Acetyl-CoA sensor PanZ family protein n=1 Tax=Kistimonas scapharcae TaxID=1036133 RepID=A0ABP8VB09_9GAMM
MPILLEILPAHPTPSDLNDLQKIYQDAPDGLLPESCNINDAADLLTTLRPDASTQLYGARFNDRLLGAVTVKEATHALTASYLCVRKVTRNRGVGKRIMDVLHQIADEKSRALHCAIPKDLELPALPAWLKAQV